MATHRHSPASSANGVRLHFDVIDLSARNGVGQTFSATVHIAILAVFLFAVASVPRGEPIHAIPFDFGWKPPVYAPPVNTQSTGRPSLGTKGGGGNNDPRPALHGDLAPGSSMPLVPPRLIHDEEVVLPEPPSIFDRNGPASVTTVKHLGLPWMNGETDSAGPGKGHGIGGGLGDGMGDLRGNGAGMGDDGGPYANVVSPVTCLYCPEPGYTEEARKAKLQGKLVLQVLVGPDGKAVRILVLQGLGMGLDERAIEAVRGWRFSSGRDASKRPVAAWVTIETRFQLY